MADITGEESPTNAYLAQYRASSGLVGIRGCNESASANNAFRSMLCFYPLDHLSYLCTHGVIPATIPLPNLLRSTSKKVITLKPGVLGMWSCRFWSLYVLLQFAHLREDRKLLLQRQRTLRKAKSVTPSEKREIAKRWDAYYNQIVINLANLPLALHWYAPAPDWIHFSVLIAI